MTTNPPEPQKKKYVGEILGVPVISDPKATEPHFRAPLASDPEPQKAGELDVPMGASAWEAHGKKYGYWDFFEKKQNERYMTLERRVTELEEEVWRIDE